MLYNTEENCNKNILVENRDTSKVREKHEIDTSSYCKYTQPGNSTERLCTFHGCRVVICNQIKNVVHLVHSPIGCAYYSWDYRSQSYGYGFTTDIQERDIIFDSEEKLYKAILKAAEEFNPDAIFVYETCIPGLIGNDLQGITKKASEEIGIPVIYFDCAGFKGATQNEGHKIANRQLFKIIGSGKEEFHSTPYDVNVIGGFSSAKEAKIIEDMLSKIGIRVLCSFTDNVTIDKIRIMDRAKINIVHCTKSSMYLAKMMYKEYGIPYIKGNFFGIENCSMTLRNIGKALNIDKDKVENFIAENLERIKEKLEFYRENLKGKRVFISHGAQRVLNYIDPLKNDLNMDIAGVATYFGNEKNYKEILKKIPKGTVVLDNPNSYELERAIVESDADVVISDNHIRYLVYKLGVPFVYGRGGKKSYVGFDGFINFADEIHGAINSKIWKLIN